MITVSESAATQVQKLIADEGMPENSFVRVGVKGGGCSGLCMKWVLTQTLKRVTKALRIRNYNCS